MAAASAAFFSKDKKTWGKTHGTGRARMSGDTIQDKDISLTFAKGMDVLKAFDAAHTHLSIADIVRITGYDRAAVDDYTQQLQRQAANLARTPADGD